MHIHLIDQQDQGHLGLSFLESLHPGELVVCDFYISDIEKVGRPVPGGFQAGRVLNIDHHAPVRQMERPISSGTLALERLRTVGPPPRGAHIIINHTDCDSVISSALMAGRLPPEDRFGDAVIAADHTGEDSDIADLLMGLQHHRDLELSLRNLDLLLVGAPLDSVAEDGLAERRRRRQAARRLVEEGRFHRIGGVAYVGMDEDTDSEFFPAVLPEAVLFVLAVPCKKHPTPAYRDVKLRLGQAAPDGLSLHHLKMNEFDHGYGGRWNAGANRRGGGTTIPLEDYAAEVARRLDALLARR